ncbi:MAG: hypothetical protein A2Y17_13090 [Clostridiales bacterium GWF2_38_85]|nr:MAG: hypothetical protein A2Y17_13090 [Clostridiales bacterium GWF2_38_85]
MTQNEELMDLFHKMSAMTRRMPPPPPHGFEGHPPMHGDCPPPPPPHGFEGHPPMHDNHPPHRAGRLLTILNEEGSMNQRKLAEMLDIRPQSLSEVIAMFEADGLIVREANSEDRREFLVSLTEAGKETAVKIDSQRKKHADEFFSALTEEEKAKFLELLKKIVDSHSEKL